MEISASQRRACRILIGKQERMEKKVRDGIAAITRELADAGAAVAECESRLSSGVEQELACRQRIVEAMEGAGAVAPNDLIVRGWQAETLARQVAEATRARDEARSVQGAVRQRLGDERRTLMRIGAKLDIYRRRLLDADRQALYRADEVQDEESEEAAVARALRARARPEVDAPASLHG